MLDVLPGCIARATRTAAPPAPIHRPSLTRDDFASFLDAVLVDFSSGGAQVEERDSRAVPRRLGYFSAARTVGPDDQETPTWKIFANMIVAATGYEQERSRHQPPTGWFPHCHASNDGRDGAGPARVKSASGIATRSSEFDP